MTRHRHQWSEVGRTFSPPRRGWDLSWPTERLVREFTFGVTSIELRCECGDVTERQLLGDHVSQGKSTLRG